MLTKSTYGYHFTVDVNQTTMLYTLNSYSDIYQLSFNKTGNKGNIYTVEKWKNRRQLKQWNMILLGWQLESQKKGSKRFPPPQSLCISIWAKPFKLLINKNYFAKSEKQKN